MSILTVVAIVIGLSINAGQREDMHKEELQKKDKIIRELSSKDIAKKVKDFNQKMEKGDE